MIQQEYYPEGSLFDWCVRVCWVLQVTRVEVMGRVSRIARKPHIMQVQPGAFDERLPWKQLKMLGKHPLIVPNDVLQIDHSGAAVPQALTPPIFNPQSSCA